MKRLTIKINNVVTNQAEFSSTEKIEAYLAYHSAQNTFGKPERWVSEDRIQAEGENIDNALEMIIEPIMGVEVKLYKFAADYVAEITDVTAEIAAQKKVYDRAKKRAFGEALIDKISTINDSKSLSIEQVDAFMTNALISNLREHLWAGNIDTFVSKLQASDVSAFFTTQEKSSVISECQTFLASLGE
jgi:hypothetical protein